MAEYTPTTDEVRYRVEHDWEPYGDGSFDRWLNQVKAEVWDEGFNTSVRKNFHAPIPKLQDNPYRKEQ